MRLSFKYLHKKTDKSENLSEVSPAAKARPCLRSFSVFNPGIPADRTHDLRRWVSPFESAARLRKSDSAVMLSMKQRATNGLKEFMNNAHSAFPLHSRNHKSGGKTRQFV